MVREGIWSNMVKFVKIGGQKLANLSSKRSRSGWTFWAHPRFFHRWSVQYECLIDYQLHFIWGVTSGMAVKGVKDAENNKTTDKKDEQNNKEDDDQFSMDI